MTPAISRQNRTVRCSQKILDRQSLKQLSCALHDVCHRSQTQEDGLRKFNEIHCKDALLLFQIEAFVNNHHLAIVQMRIDFCIACQISKPQLVKFFERYDQMFTSRADSNLYIEE